MEPEKSQLFFRSVVGGVSVQILSRALNFVLRALTLQRIHVALLGIINVRLALLYTSIQFLAKEPFRRSCIRPFDQKIVNVIWLGAPISVALSAGLSFLWMLNAPSQSDLSKSSLTDYNYAVVLTSLAVLIEMVAEPCYIYAQAHRLPDHNPLVEGVSLTIKCILTATVALYGSSSNILTKTALCQVVASTMLVVLSFSRLSAKTKLPPSFFLPSLVDGSVSNMFDSTSLKLSGSFIGQTFLKQLLTEGERYVMTFLHVISLADQGIYDIVNNLSSLSARLLFKPIEDSAYTLFSQSVSRDKVMNVKKFRQAQTSFMLLLKGALLLGLILFVFGYNFTPFIVLYGNKLDDPTAFYLMRWQMVYTPFLAVNGIVECFSFAIMDSRQMSKFNNYLIVCSLTFLFSTYATKVFLGSACFIFANCVIMTIRILISLHTTSKFFQKHRRDLELEQALPTLTTVISLIMVFAFLKTSHSYLLDMGDVLSIIICLMLGGGCFLFTILVIWLHEEELADFIGKMLRSKFD